MHQPALLALDPEISGQVLIVMESAGAWYKLATSLQQLPQRPVLLFITVSAILLINLLIDFPSVQHLALVLGYLYSSMPAEAQLNCSYDYVYVLPSVG